MNVGEVISILSLCAASFDDNKDHLLMLRDVSTIEVCDEYIMVYFQDGNTQSIRIRKDGTKEYIN